MEQPLKIVKRNYGIADRFSDGTIEIHKKLDYYPELKTALLKHERGHTHSNRVTKKDFIHDMTTNSQVPMKKMIRFLVTTPSAWVQFLPIYYTKRRGWIKDDNLLIFYGVLAGLIGIVSLVAILI